MQRNLKIKGVVIVATVLVCLFGIIGFPRNLKQLESNVTSRIHLGLDLKGGSHLVLQVQVQDAAKTEADQAIESLRDAARTGNIAIEGFDRNDPQTLQEPIPSRSTSTASTRPKRSSSAVSSPTSIRTGFWPRSAPPTTR
jgi:preprotein translocase subunit SecD